MMSFTAIFSKMYFKALFQRGLPLVFILTSFSVYSADTLSIAAKDSVKPQSKTRFVFISKLFSSQKDSVKSRPKLTHTIDWDARSSFVDKKLVNIWGVNTGIKFGRGRHELNIGYYWLTFNSFLRLLDFRKDASKVINLNYYTKTDLYFFSLMYRPNLIDNQRWRFSIPLELGIGATQSTANKLFNDLMIWRRNDFFMPAQMGLYLKWKATRWVGFSVQGGYRYALYQQNLPANYNGAYYSLGFTLESEIFTDSYQWAKNSLKKRNERRGKRPNERL
jgi:hypothetical protein